MVGEGRFIDTVGNHTETVLPGGAKIEGPVQAEQSSHIIEYYDTAPLCVKKVGAGAATGTAGDENMYRLNNSTWDYHVLGTQTILAPTQGTYGLNIVQDETENDGTEHCLGINAKTKGVFTVGTSPAFFARMKFYIDDVSGTDDCAFGFRKVEAYQANIDDYADMAVLNVISGDIKIETIVGDAATVTTDTTANWADTETHELKVLVSAAGVVTYQIDGGTPATVAAYTFTDALAVVPFFYQLAAADPEAAAVELIEFECGLQ